MTIAQMVSQVTAAPKATLKAVKAPKTHAELMEAVQVVTGAPASPNCTVDQLKSILAGINKAPKAKPVKAPKAPKAVKTPKAPKAKKVTKYDLLRTALKEGNKTLEALISASGFDAKNVRVSISILRGRFGMEVAYDKEAKTYTAPEVGAPIVAV